MARSRPLDVAYRYAVRMEDDNVTTTIPGKEENEKKLRNVAYALFREATVDDRLKKKMAIKYNFPWSPVVMMDLPGSTTVRVRMGNQTFHITCTQVE